MTVSTPPYGPNDHPQDRPPVPGQQPPYPGNPGGPGGGYPGQPGPPGQPPYPGQPGQYPGQPGGPPQYPAQPTQPAYPGQPGQYGGQPQYNPAQPGYNPYSQTGGFGFNYAPPGQLAGWGSRVGASLLDSLIALVPVFVGFIAALAISGDMESMSGGGSAVLTISYLACIGIQLWNRVFKQGRTGQSIGKQVVGLKIVNAETGQLIGMGSNFGREVCAVIFNYICFLNVLWPLWDDKHQTWHDKVVSDIVIKL